MPKKVRSPKTKPTTPPKPPFWQQWQAEKEALQGQGMGWGQQFGYGLSKLFNQWPNANSLWGQLQNQYGYNQYEPTTHMYPGWRPGTVATQPAQPTQPQQANVQGVPPVYNPTGGGSGIYFNPISQSPGLPYNPPPGAGGGKATIPTSGGGWRVPVQPYTGRTIHNPRWGSAGYYSAPYANSGNQNPYGLSDLNVNRTTGEIGGAYNRFGQPLGTLAPYGNTYTGGYRPPRLQQQRSQPYLPGGHTLNPHNRQGGGKGWQNTEPQIGGAAPRPNSYYNGNELISWRF